jgi:hypothetical protein
MASQGTTAGVGIIAGLVSFVLLFCLEGALYFILFGGHPGDSFSLFFILLGLGMILIPANIIAATLIGKRVSEEQRRQAQE